MMAVRSDYGVWTLASLLLPFAMGCDDSTGPDGFSTEDLIVELAVTPDHIHAFETPVMFTVAVADPEGNPVADFDVLQVERKHTTAATFSAMEATLSGDFYVVEHTFEASGDYAIRVTGLRPGDGSLVVLHEAPTLLHTIRPHGHVGGYEIQLEPNPGHIHVGDTSDVQFWISDPTSGAGIGGLTPTIFIDHAVAGLSEYAATTGTDGLYHTMHTFTHAGPTTMGIRFTGTDQNQHEWSLDVEIHDAH